MNIIKLQKKSIKFFSLRMVVSIILTIVITLGSWIHTGPQKAFASGSHVQPNEWVVNPLFDSAQPLFDGLVLYKINDGTSFSYSGVPIYCIVNVTISDSGGYFMDTKYDDIIISPTKTEFEQASSLFAAHEAGTAYYSFYNKHGDLKLRGEYKEVTLFDSGIAWVKNSENLWGAITTEGMTSASFIYNECVPVGGGSAIVRNVSSGFYGVVDKKGKVIYQMELSNAERIPLDTNWKEKDSNNTWVSGVTNKGWAYVPEYGNRIFYIKDKAGNKIYGMYRIDSSGDVNGTPMTVSGTSITTVSGLIMHPVTYGTVAPENQPSDNVKYDVATTGMYSSIEILNGIYIEPSSLTTYDYFAPLWKVEQGGKYGVVGIDGDLIASCVYDSVDLIYPNGMYGNMPFAIITSGVKKGLVSPKGMVFDAVYDDIQVTKEGTTTAYYLIETKSGAVKIPYLLDKDFNYIRINPYITFERDPATGYRVECKLNTTTGKYLYGMTDRFGVEIIPFQYDMLDFFHDGYAQYAKRGANGELNYGLIGIMDI